MYATEYNVKGHKTFKELMRQEYTKQSFHYTPRGRGDNDRERKKWEADPEQEHFLSPEVKMKMITIYI
jgi:hypothetical protein